MNLLELIFDHRPEVLLLALIIDVLFAEPPGAVHPVVWMGKAIEYLKNIPLTNKKLQGIFMVIVMSGISFLAGVVVVNAAFFLPETIALLVLAYFLKSTFSFRMLLTFARHIMNRLEPSTLDAAKHDLKALVSRDTTGLDEPHIASAVIESTSENFVDGIVSPLFFYLILGVPGALAYKAVNTLDSMVGYLNEEFIELGWASARFDDFLNWVPARLSLIFIIAASLFTGSPANAVNISLRDRNRTLSPNSGWPMAAAAGALEVKLEKQGHYVLGKDFRMPKKSDIEHATKLIGLASIFLFVSVLALLYRMS
jgi:adenosylcobinamide-phosphate synthase